MSAPETTGTEDRWIEIDRGPIQYRLRRADPRQTERRPPLVFLHEGLGSITQWRSFPDDVCAEMGNPTTLVYARHGHGRSAAVTEPRTPHYMHHEALVVLPALLAALDIERPVLVGHSDGASIALLHAGAGHDVAGLVLIAPHVLVEPCTIESIAAARTAYATTDLPARLARHHDDADATFRGWNDVWLDPAFRHWNIESTLPAITAPVLLVQGDADEYGTLDQLVRIERAVSGPTRRVVVPGVGHAPHLWAQDVTTAAVVGFLRDGDVSGP